MQNKKNLMTIILPLWDRELYTPTWIKENLFDGFDYIIADGSKADANKDIFSALDGRANVKYIRYPFDASIADYVGKMLDAVSKVETPYVMTVDNDDFLSYEGIVACINALQHNDVFGLANGYVRSVIGMSRNVGNSKKSYRLRSGKMDAKSLNNKTGILAINELFHPYKYVYYAVFRTELCKKIWEEVVISKLDDIFLIEYLHGQLAFCYSKMYAVNRTHYIRLSNPVSSSAKEFAPDNYPSSHGIYFDEHYRAQVLKMGEIIAMRLGVDKHKIYAEYRLFYANQDKPPRLRVHLMEAIYAYIYNSISPPLSINTIRKMA